MEINQLIIIGLLLIALAILFALPFLGVGMVIPILGDMIDVPLSFVMGIVGVVMLVLGGFLQILVQYWYVLALVAAILVLLNVFKIRIKVMT